MDQFIFHVRVQADKDLQHKWNTREIVVVSTTQDLKKYIDAELLNDRVGYPVRVKLPDNVLRQLRYGDLEVIELGKANDDVREGLILKQKTQ